MIFGERECIVHFSKCSLQALMLLELRMQLRLQLLNSFFLNRTLFVEFPDYNICVRKLSTVIFYFLFRESFDFTAPLPHSLEFVGCRAHHLQCRIKPP